MSNTDLNIVLKIKELKEEAQDYLSIIFEKPRGFTYTPGNWMDIRFPIPEFPVGKTYSFSSSPTESDLFITFKKGVSRFKKALEIVRPGDTMLITQYGSNGFLLNNHSHSVFIAGGIGIAPFRSMIKETIDINEKIDITVIYLNRTDDFPFRKELDIWNESSPLLKIHYFVSGQEKMSKEKIQELIPDIIHKMNYVAGPPGMVNNISDMLLAIGVKKENIKTDSFTGY